MNRDDSCLLVDNSNTRTKFALCEGGELSEIRVLPTADISALTVQNILRGWSFARVCLCSVVPWAGECLRAALQGYPLAHVKPEVSSLVDFSSYPGVATLGADRVANVLAAVAISPLPVVAVDLGTATTLDVVTGTESHPVFRGGMIAPGYAAVAAALDSRTAQLPAISELAGSGVIGQDTRQAMSAAVRVGYPGMIDALLDAVEAELGVRIHVILTGGDAEVVSCLMRRKCRIEPRLTLQGIALAAGLRL